MPAELEDLMRGARRRVLQLIAIVVSLLALISSRIPIPTPVTPAVVIKLSVWGMGCLVIMGLAMLWYESRSAATRRLSRLLESGTARIESVEVTPIALEIMPFGVEVDLLLDSGERLAFGYWTRAPADRLLEIITENLA